MSQKHLIITPGEWLGNPFFSTTRHNELRINQWNVSSIKIDTIQIAKFNQPHIICLLETRGKMLQNSPGYNYIQKFGVSNHQGGIAIGIISSINFEDIRYKFSPSNSYKYDFLAIHCKSELVDVVICNFYFKSKTIFNQSKQEFQLWFNNLQSIIKSTQQVVICGDFNTSTIDLPPYRNAIPTDILTFKREKITRTLISRTDHCFTLNFKNQSCKTFFNKLSDHCLIQLQLEYNISKRKEHKIEYCKKKAYELNQKAVRQFKDFTCRKYNVIQKQRITLSKMRPFNSTLEQKLQNVAEMYQTKDQKEAYKAIQQIAILNPYKRDGGIFRCFKNEYGELRCGNECISNCLNQLGKISNSVPFSPQQLPSLLPLTIIEVQELQNQMSQEKAITRDGISDTFIKKTKSSQLLQNLWQNSTLETNIYLGEARLIPLNKAYPDIPTPNQFRLIVVMSPLFKFMELRFAPKLQRYIYYDLKFRQAGFIEGRGTKQNIDYIISKISQTKKMDKLDAIFIDFSNAYNTICRGKLFQILRNKSILSTDEINFLVALHSNLHFKDPSQKNAKVFFENGVVQGSPISPLLFNIYLDEFLTEFSNTIQIEFEVYAYADDLVFFVKHNTLINFMSQLEIVANKWTLIINKKKSGIFILQNHLQRKPSVIIGYPIVNKYNYLGITISNKASVQDHIKKIGQQLKSTETKLKWISQQMPLYKQITLWKIYINSVLLQADSAVKACQSLTYQEKYNKLRRMLLKKLIGLPKSCPNKFIDIINKTKKNNRITSDVRYLFCQGGKICVEHEKRGNYKHLINEHLHTTEDNIYKYLIGNNKGKIFKKNMKNKLKLLIETQFIKEKQKDLGY